MGDNVVLRFQYKGKDSDVVVKHVDKVNLIDLIIEYWEVGEREENPMPKYPKITYIHRMKHVELVDDKELMQMFLNLPGRDMIYLHVWEEKKPSAVVKSALTLRSSQQQSQPQNQLKNANETDFEHIESPIGTPNQPNETHLSNSPLTQTQPLEVQPIQTDLPKKKPSENYPTPTRRSPRHMPEVILDMDYPLSPSQINDMIVDNTEFWNDITITEIEPNKGRGRGCASLRGKGKAKGKGRGNVTTLEDTHTIGLITEAAVGQSSLPPFSPKPTAPSTYEVGQPSTLARATPMLKRRIPKTTAKRKSLLKLTTNEGNTGGPFISDVSNNRRRISSHVNTTLDLEEQQPDNDSSDSYCPSDVEDSSEDESVEDEVDEGMAMLEESMPLVHDTFDPYEGPVWEDDTDDFDNYL